MNVYDFDNTIYAGDSSVDFWRFCLKKNFSLARFLPKQFFSAAQFFLKKISRKEFKEKFFCFLNGIQNAQSLTEEFWQRNERKIRKWYLLQKSGGDIIISAGPEFLLKPIAVKLGVSLIATKMDFRTGKIAGENCRGQEKVRRLFEEHNLREHKIAVENFYSDSKSDMPLAAVSQNAFLVKANHLKKWRKDE